MDIFRPDVAPRGRRSREFFAKFATVAIDSVDARSLTRPQERLSLSLPVPQTDRTAGGLSTIHVSLSQGLS